MAPRYRCCRRARMTAMKASMLWYAGVSGTFTVLLPPERPQCSARRTLRRPSDPTCCTEKASAHGKSAPTTTPLCAHSQAAPQWPCSMTTAMQKDLPSYRLLNSQQFLQPWSAKTDPPWPDLTSFARTESCPEGASPCQLGCCIHHRDEDASPDLD